MKIKVNNDCRYFKGDIPCSYHKKENVICETCSYYDPIKEKTLIIKLGAAGDVIRTTPILRKLKQIYPASYITWLTLTPELVPADWVDQIWASPVLAPYIELGPRIPPELTSGASDHRPVVAQIEIRPVEN